MTQTTAGRTKPGTRGTSKGGRRAPARARGKAADEFSTVRRLALAMPDVEESTSFGKPAFKIGGRMFACAATHKSAEPGTLVVRVPFEQRDDLIAERPDLYYLKEHYVNYACVLVRLARVDPDALHDLLLMGRRFAMGKGKG